MYDDDELDKIYKQAFEDYMKRKKRMQRKIRFKKSAYKQAIIIIVDMAIIITGALLALFNI